MKNLDKILKVVGEKINKNSFINQTLTLFVFIGLASGCTETIELELETAAKRLVVDGNVTNEQKMHFLRLSESVSFFSDSASPTVSGAQVLISDGINVERLSEAQDIPGIYYTSENFGGVPGRTYSLSVSNVDIDEDGEMEEYTSHAPLPDVSAPDSITMEFDEGWNVWKILLYARENPETEDYYMFRLFKNGTLISNTISEYSVVSDKFFDEGNANGIWVQSIDAGQESGEFEEGDVITLQMCGITEEYFDFVQAVQQENRGQYPLFSGPPANVPGNISNGALGFFSAFSVSYVSLLYHEGEDYSEK
ncbi:DUF4249 domain-containing protein [Marinilabilia rubra]|uniref:DUF4249 domain-containing protein n=1 Tax=Marinilabilia rubra TaxID=2162893 RepID=UPI001E54472D|nr:DUF4249 domain-containing protein [Marinilabilia rubra]